MKDSRKDLINAVLDGVVGLLFILWFFLPVASGPVGGKVLFVPFSMPGSFLSLLPGSIPGMVLFAVYAVPALGLLKILSVFLGKRLSVFGTPDGLFASLSRIVASGLMVYAFILPLLSFAFTSAYFLSIPLTGWIFGALAVAGNIASMVIFLKSLNVRNPVYREYRAFKQVQKVSGKNAPKEGGMQFLEIFFRIRSKLSIAFIGLISFTLITLSVLLLYNYRITILKAVGDGARSQVEQASSIYRVNLGDNIAMFEYLTRQVELNAKAEFAYQALTLYTDQKNKTYLDALPATLPDYRVEYSTLDKLTQFPNFPVLSGASSLTYAQAYAKDGNVISAYDPAARTFSFISPIIKLDTIKQGDAKFKRPRLLGFSTMIFQEDVIMRPFFKTRNSVIVLTTLFIYLAIILTYVIGNVIVNPLLFLKMNVRKISDILGSMIRGEARVSANTLVYDDCIKGRDEIKSLSGEINDMVTVIRGIIPYISASTLKQAEKGTASSSERELSFLFTDIRGFTTLCEGMQPDQVVNVLNRYLDLETEIILSNKGDVDKFVGDEMMAFFDGPEKELNACRAAMQIRQAMMEEKERRQKEGLPIVAIGIGINTGPVVFGSVGARDRMDFTSIGDTVNLAARLESANKQYGSKSIITDAVYQQVKDHFLCRQLDFIAVKGKSEPVCIYEILQTKEKSQPKLMQIAELFETGLDAYRKRKWKTAAAAFKKNMELYNDGPSKVFYDRIVEFSKNPPPDDWDGVYRSTEK